ncbi:hypothetical protein A359_00640 [secondary endosymbiont of Ctenarytaina eucalypti]|uniref:Uncharacterized protein n=1 Tax=secondary endosymbiont of Ctenarytaina eucalypti TaxID=1199245 RepID=J3Z2P6_9ENTR|nr:hypothetical protein A359_00640 [secondary endosymbiont of Ctenarytaina eucalypti]
MYGIGNVKFYSPSDLVVQRKTPEVIFHDFLIEALLRDMSLPDLIPYHSGESRSTSSDVDNIDLIINYD